MLLRTRMKRLVSVILIIACMTGCGILTACGTDDIDISSYASKEVVLSGIQDEDIVLTIADLKAMECKTVKTHSTSDKIGDVRATGPELDIVLAAYGVSKSDFDKIIIYGTDQYDVKLKNDYITTNDIYLAFGVDGEPLDTESAPCRIIIPESDSAYWTRMVNRIEFIR